MCERTAGELRVAPEQLAHEARVGRLVHAFDLCDLLERDVVFGEKAAVHHENALIAGELQEVRERQVIERVGEEPRQRLAVFGLHFALEAVHLVHRQALVVPCSVRERMHAYIISTIFDE